VRIAMVAACPFPAPRGTPIRVHRMAEALGRRGHDVHVITYHLGDVAPDAPMTIHRIRGPGWYTRTAPGPSLMKLAVLDPLLIWKLRSVLAKHAADVIHAHHYEGLLVALLARPRRSLPIVFDAHTLLETELPVYGSRLGAAVRAFLGRALDRSLPARADQIVAVSEEIRARFASTGDIDAARLSVIANGVEVEHFRTQSPQTSAQETLVFAGNLAPYQGVDLLLEAFAAVRLRRPSARLHILTGDDFGPFAPVARRLGIAEHVEVLDVDYGALPEHLSRATVLANPRLDCSGIPQKLLNYMASGTPAVSFASSAKLLAHERSGLIVADGDVQGFAAAILRLMNDPALCQRLGEHAQETVARDYTWGQVAARIEQVYERVVVAP
jgi:glycosyltransferase involved in cell wall biosynthesis